MNNLGCDWSNMRRQCVIGQNGITGDMICQNIMSCDWSNVGCRTEIKYAIDMCRRYEL